MLSLKTAFSGKIENSAKFSKAGIKPPILANHSAANPQRDRQFQFPTDASVFHRSLPKYLMPTHLQTNPSKPAQSNSFTRRHFNVVSPSINVDLPPTLIFINAFSVYAELIFLSSFIFEMVNPNDKIIILIQSQWQIQSQSQIQSQWQIQWQRHPGDPHVRARTKLLRLGFQQVWLHRHLRIHFRGLLFNHN